jgi:hypothetical protein
MVRTKEKTIDDYISRIEKHLLRKYPQLEFEPVKWSECEATVYYRPYSADDAYAIIHRIADIATDALVDSGFRIYVIPKAN